MKTLILFFLACATVNASNQQEEILFKQEIKPGKKYTWTVKSVSIFSLDVSGTGEEIQKLKATGQIFPSTRESSSEEVRVLRTGSINVEKSFPAILTYIKCSEIIVENGERTESQKQIPLTSFSGAYNSKNKFEIVSAKDSSKKDLSKRQFHAFKANYNKLQENLDLSPDIPMKIGDGFDQKGIVRLRFPGCKKPVIITIISNYKLKNIDNNIATFDVTKIVGFNSSSRRGKIEVNGKGNGIAEFDVISSHIIKEETNDETAITLKMSGLQMTGSFKTKTNQQIKIE
jgi:hypothetical protein